MSLAIADPPPVRRWLNANVPSCGTGALRLESESH